MMRWMFLALLLLTGCDSSPRGTRDARVPDLDSGPDRDAGGAVDGGGDAGQPVDAGRDAGGPQDASTSPASVGLSFTGCAPSFDGDVVVVRNADSIAVSATSGGALTGSIQLALEDGPGLVNLSTQHRVDSGSVINVIVGTTWTNIAMRSGEVLGGTLADPIGGTLQVRAYDEAAGIVDVDFTSVTLQNPSDGTICRIDGTLVTTGLSF